MPHIYSQKESTLKRIEGQQWFIDAKMDYFVSEVIAMLHLEDDHEIETSINRSIEACEILKIPFNRNFKRIYRYNGCALIADWKISSLALYLIVINCNPNNELVAKAQLYFALKNANHLKSQQK